MVGLQAQLLDALGRLFVELGRDDELREARRVLGLIVVKLALGPQLDEGQRAVLPLKAQDARGDLLAGDEFFNEKVAVFALGRSRGLDQLVLVLGDTHADAGALPHRLHHAGEAEFPLDVRGPALPSAGRVVLRTGVNVRGCREACAVELALGGQLVHGQRTGQWPGARVRAIEKLQQQLDRPVFADPTVQAVEHDIHARNLLDEPIWVVEDELYSVVAAALQGLIDVGPRAQRHFAFGGEPAHQHPDALSLEVHGGPFHSMRSRPRSSRTEVRRRTALCRRSRLDKPQRPWYSEPTCRSEGGTVL